MTDATGIVRSERARADVNAIWFGLAALLAFVSVGLALVSQHVFDMQPCPWCVLQRLILILVGVLAVLGLVLRKRVVGAGAAAVLALALCGSGFAAAMWQISAEKSASCNLTLADRIVGATQLDRLIPDVFEARASCADAAVKVYGFPYWKLSAAAFTLCGALMCGVLRNLRL